MACINPDGTLTPTAQKVLATLSIPSTAVDIGKTTALPIYRIRATIRELIEANLVTQSESTIYQLTDAGKQRLRTEQNYGNDQ